MYHPSPLSPRSSTASWSMDNFPASTRRQATPSKPRTHQQSNSNFPPSNTTTTTTAATSPTYAQRYASISNPLSHASQTFQTSTSPSARTTRRSIFLNRIKQERDAGRFESRGEQLMMMEDAAERKQWGEAMRRRADRLMRVYHLDKGPGECEMDGLDDADVDVDARALDEYVSEEQAMETALLENMRMGRSQVPSGSTDRSRDVGSSFGDEEYEDIFMDLADHIPQDQDMDISP